MPFIVEQNDITKVKADAVVLPANPGLREGRGTSQMIFEAAGREALTAACREIGFCPAGTAVSTAAYALPAKRIIHAVCPRYIDGRHREADYLRSAYLSALRLAESEGLHSIAFPLLSSGTYGYPKGEALDIANRAIRDHLETSHSELEVRLIIYDKQSLAAASDVFGEIGRRIEAAAELNHISFESIPMSDRPTLDITEAMTEALSESSAEVTLDHGSGAAEDLADSDLQEPAVSYSMPAPQRRDAPASRPERKLNIFDNLSRPARKAQSLEELIVRKTQSFTDLLTEYIIRSEMTNPAIYHNANLSKQAFSKVISGTVVPKKSTVLALSIALRLSLEETETLLMKAGHALSDADEADIIVKFFIEQQRYDVQLVNEALFYYDQPLLGTVSS